MSTTADECSFETCDARIKGLGLCSGHKYQLQMGIPLRPILRNWVDRFWVKVDKKSPEDCWEWTGEKSWSGYGFFQRGKRGEKQAAHRVSFEIYSGEPVSKSLQIDHKCRNRGCVNPDHLQVVTNKQNQENRGLDRSNTSGYRGVSWHKRVGKWQARLTHNGRHIHIGYFETAEDAAEAAKKKRFELYTNNLSDDAKWQR